MTEINAGYIHFTKTEANDLSLHRAKVTCSMEEFTVTANRVRQVVHRKRERERGGEGERARQTEGGEACMHEVEHRHKTA